MDLLIEFKKYLLQGREKHSKITVKNYLSDVKKFITWFEETFHREFIPSIVTNDLTEIYKIQLSKPNRENKILAARSIKRYFSSLKKFYSFLVLKDLTTQNPFDEKTTEPHISTDQFHLKEFKNFLLLSHASKTTIKNYLMDISKFTNWLNNLPDKKTLQEIDIILIEEYKNRLLYQAKFSPNSVNRNLSSLRKYFSWLKNQKYINSEPVFQQTTIISKDIERLQKFGGHEESQDAKDPLLTKRVQDDKNNAHPNEFIYSSFPPMRLLQKLFRFSNLIFDLLFLLPIVKLILMGKHELWKLTGKKIFTTPIDNLITNKGIVPKGLPKSLYAPLKISTEDMPLHIKLYHHLRHTRPYWYKKYHSYALAHYLHFGILLIYVLILGFTIYNHFIDSARLQSQSVLGSADSPARLLAFSGRLTDNANNPVSKESSLRFALYNDRTASGSAMLWQENQVIKPDQDGNFKTTLGQHQAISQDFLNNNPNLFLGITIGYNPELAPRQQIATTSYTSDSEKLQGMLPITDPQAGTNNIILALDSSGNLTIGGHASPKFEATGGEFILSGQTLTLKTTEGSNTNVQISPDGAGIIDLQKLVQNTTNYGMIPETEGMVQVADSLGIITNSSTQSALLINQNGVGNLISANGAGSAKFTLDYLGSGMFAQDLAINGNNLTSDSYTFNLLNKNVVNLSIGNEASTISIGSASGTTIINNNLNVSGMIYANGGLTIPQGKDLIFEGSTSGSITFIGNNHQLSQDQVNFFWDNTNKRLGLGTIIPSYRLDVQDNQAATAAAQIYNSNIGPDAGGLILKLGAGTAATTNKFLSFQTAAGEISSITGDGSNGIQIHQGGWADWAEYIDKDPNETISFGSLVCIKENGKATSCDESNSKILGIASEHPTIIAGQNKGDGSIAVGLTGLVRTLVSSQNGNIKPGDLITSSSVPGIGVKAIQKGMVAGRALEAYENTNSSETGTILVVLQTTWFDPEVQLASSGDLNIQSPSNLTINSSPSQPTIIENLIDNLTTGLLEAKKLSTQSLSIATDNITIGGSTLKEYITSIVTDILNTKYNIENTNLVSPIAQIDRIDTSLISPLASDSAIAIKLEKDKLSILRPEADQSLAENSNDSVVASIDNQGNASFAGDIEARQASFSGTLRARRIIADEIQGLNIQTATLSANYITNITNIYNTIATPSASPVSSEPGNLSTIQSLNDIQNTKYQIQDTNSTSSFPRFEQGLLALGASSLSEVAITGNLHLGQSTTFYENTINSIGANLELQPLRQGDLSIMGGLVKINTEGNLSVSGNAIFAKDVSVQGVLSANIISPVPDGDLIVKLGTINHQPSTINHQPLFMIQDSAGRDVLHINQLGDLIASGSGTFKNIVTDGLTIIRGAQADTSFTETIASGSAGTAVITAYETERTIKTPFVKDNSLIYISPISDTYGQTPYIARQATEDKNTKGSFTIQIPRFVTKDIKINWWIVN